MSNEGLRKRGLLLIWHERGAGVPRATPPKTDRRGGVEGGSCGDRRPARNASREDRRPACNAPQGSLHSLDNALSAG